MISKPDNIIFVKHGDKYNEAHVNRLYQQLIQYYPEAKFFCYTDNKRHIDARIRIIPVYEKPSLRLWWNKLAMFSKHFPVEGNCLYFDLDMDVKRDPTSVIQWNPNALTILKDYWKDDLYMARHAYDVHINSSVIAWTAGQQTHVWDHFMTNRDYFMRKYEGMDRFLVHEKISLETFEHGIVNSIANPYEGDAPIDMYNGIDYELPRNSL